jgi:molybdenum cofactor cytidylyltransferase
MEALHGLASVQGLPILIEADGSRRCPLKAPAAYEPLVPPWVKIVVVVAGLTGIGKPLSEDWVHRPERFAALSDLEIGQPITPQALVQVLTHPAGGLKGLPSQARRIALLNQADAPELQALAGRLSAQLLGPYAAVLVASLTSSADHPVLAVHEPVAGVILAAGASSRFGSPKQTLLWRDQPLVRHVASAALQAGLSPVVVVTGDSSALVKQALDGMPVIFVKNSEWQAGQSTSLAAGLRFLPPVTGAAVFLLADQPQVTPGLLHGLVELHAATLSSIIAPQVYGQRANPVLFDRLTFPELLSLKGDMGGRALFSRYHPTWLPWNDANLLLDVDTPEDYRKLLEM